MNKEKAKTIALWVIQILIALIFLAAGLPKLMSNPGIVERFRHWGFPDKFYLFIGVVEVLGGFGLLVPKLTGYAALLLFGNMIGVVITHATHNEFERLPFPVLLLILLGIVAYAKRPAFLLNPSA